MEQAPHALASLKSQSPAEVSDFFSGVLTAAADTPPSSGAAQCALSVFRDAARRGLTAEQLEAELRGAGVSEAISAAASRSWSMHGTDARWALTAGAIGARKLIDAEWCATAAPHRPAAPCPPPRRPAVSPPSMPTRAAAGRLG